MITPQRKGAKIEKDADFSLHLCVLCVEKLNFDHAN